ncbi:transcriptional regulator with XRE-family HTH domain [Catenulispora sp. GP43]|uniref:XRE family transcriptional regulator n=1 Tax=Catenulispora sp. GP43 TaxID=3156263 RepID=UPI00351594C9
MTAHQTETRGEVTTLAAELRRLREQAGLSFAALGEQTPYSRSAWQRYLTAKVLPPWQAVRDLCRLAGEPEPRLRALWELAESADRGRGEVMAEPPKNEPEPEPEPIPLKRRGIHVRIGLVTALIAVVAMAAAGVYLLRDSDSGGTPSRATTGAFTVTCTTGSCKPTCHGAACAGQDPGLTLCGIQARPLQQQQTSSGIGLEVRYNSECQTAWARFWNTRVGDSLTLTAPGEPTQSIRIANQQDANDFSYTPMVYVPTSGIALRVCVTPAGGTPACYTDTVS